MYSNEGEGAGARNALIWRIGCVRSRSGARGAVKGIV